MIVYFGKRQLALQGNVPGEQGLYEKYGFMKLGDFETIYGGMDQLFEKVI